jgi:hypothetical protein
VQFRANDTGILGALAVAIALGGCGNADWENKEAWFSKPFQVVSKRGGYTYSNLDESKQRARAITANGLVEANGSCPPPEAQQAPASATVDSPGGVAPATDTSALLGGGIALGMSECDVVFRAGAPSNIQIDQNPNGDRTAVLTFNSGPRPGIYHFRGGALTDIERGQITPPPTQTAKKKPVTSPKPNKQAAKE